jgi:lysophospholipase L1-like esterase
VIRKFLVAATAALLLVSSFAQAEIPWTFLDNTRYLAMGDSLGSGLGAIPVTQGYAYLLYQGGVFDSLTNTTFADAAVPNAESLDVLEFQVPQALKLFKPQVVTLTVGGNDLLEILADPRDQTVARVLTAFATNLDQILRGLRAGLPNFHKEALIIIGNQYEIPDITASFPRAPEIIAHFNDIIAQVAGQPDVHVAVANVHDAFQGRNGLLLIERHGAGASEVHPTNAGYRVMADAFAAAAAAAAQ